MLEVLASVIRQEKAIKHFWIEKEEAKKSLFTDDMITFVENFKPPTKKLPEILIIREFNKIVGHKTNIQ